MMTTGQPWTNPERLGLCDPCLARPEHELAELGRSQNTGHQTRGHEFDELGTVCPHAFFFVRVAALSLEFQQLILFTSSSSYECTRRGCSHE